MTAMRVSGEDLDTKRAPLGELRGRIQVIWWEIAVSQSQIDENRLIIVQGIDEITRFRGVGLKTDSCRLITPSVQQCSLRQNKVLECIGQRFKGKVYGK